MRMFNQDTLRVQIILRIIVGRIDNGSKNNRRTPEIGHSIQSVHQIHKKAINGIGEGNYDGLETIDIAEDDFNPEAKEKLYHHTE